MRTVVALSGGKASAWCAKWAAENRDNVVLYFNDTKWEHPDLYRFIDEVAAHVGLPIHSDSDGRSPEELFQDKFALANNRMPFCSRILKAERLQKFVQDGDELVFGIGPEEMHRAARITQVYQLVAAKRGIDILVRFPLIEHRTNPWDIDSWLKDAGIEQPYLYTIGFTHNNCSGGCVRAGKKQWKLLLEKLPEVYAERERVENEMREWLGKDIHFLKDETLEQFRGRCERGELSAHYYKDDDYQGECMGICTLF